MLGSWLWTLLFWVWFQSLSLLCGRKTTGGIGLGGDMIVQAFTLVPIGRQPHSICHPSHVSSSQYLRSDHRILSTSTTSLFSSEKEDEEEAEDIQPNSSSEDEQQVINDSLKVLYRAAETKQEDSDVVYQALMDLEQGMRRIRQQQRSQQGNDNGKLSVAAQIREQLTGRWQLVFTTGTAKTLQKTGGRRINYFPLTAIQSFNTTAQTIANGIYFGGTDWAFLEFVGTMEWDETKCRVNFDFDQLQLFNGGVKIPLKPMAVGDAAAAAPALDSKKKKLPFFNWISADERIATARGGGGGLALWKRV